MLASLKVSHKCKEKGEIKRFKYEELKKHVNTDCEAFKYDCVLCNRADQRRDAQAKIQEKLRDLDADGKGQISSASRPSIAVNNMEKIGSKIDKYTIGDKIPNKIEVGRDKLNDPINIINSTYRARCSGGGALEKSWLNPRHRYFITIVSAHF